jgi:hypothetical protein
VFQSSKTTEPSSKVHFLDVLEVLVHKEFWLSWLGVCKFWLLTRMLVKSAIFYVFVYKKIL